MVVLKIVKCVLVVALTLLSPTEVFSQCNDNTCTLPHIISFGRTGVGKSWMGNKLTQPNTFKEGDTVESQTTDISTAPSWNGDLFADVPGYFDSQGRDPVQQANFVDFVENKTIRAILFIFTDKLDSFAQSALDAFKQSNLRNNVILVCNKDLTHRTADVGDYQGFPLIYVKAHPENVNVLKQYIAAKSLVKAEHMITPAALFKQPLHITQEPEVDTYINNEVIQEPETQRHCHDVRVNKRWQGKRKWHGKAGTWYDNWVTEQVCENKQVMVDKHYRVYHKHKLTYAERFDAKWGLFKKDFAHAFKQPA